MAQEKKHFTAFEWLILGGAVVAAIAASKFFGLAHKWENALVYSVGLFGILLLSLRDLWKRPSFWRNVLAAFGLHLFVMFPVMRNLPPEWNGIPGLFMLVSAMIEGILLLGFLWKTTMGSAKDQFPR